MVNNGFFMILKSVVLTGVGVATTAGFVVVMALGLLVSGHLVGYDFSYEYEKSERLVATDLK